MTTRIVKAESLPRKVAIGYAGTDAAPRPMVHATAYKRQDGVILVAMVKGGVVELRNDERVRYSATPAEDGAANLRWCHQCAERHLKYVTAGKTGACYCREQVLESSRRFRETTKARAGKTPAQIEADRVAAAEATANARVAEVIDRVMAHRPASREQMIAGLLSRTAETYGMDSARFATVAAMYHLTVDAARDLATGYEPVVATA